MKLSEKGSITTWQLTALIIANKLSMLTTYAPIVTGTTATRDAWISAWVAALAAMLITVIPLALLKRFPGQTAFQVARRVMGKWGGALINLIFLALFIHFGGLAFRQFAEVFVVAMLPETPLHALTFLMAILAVYGSAGGVALLGRIGELVTPAILLSLVLLIVLSVPHISLTRLLPVFERGVGPMIDQTLTPIGIFGEMAWIMLLCYPYLLHPEQSWKAVRNSTLINGLAVSLGAAFLIAVMGPELIDLELFPTITATRLIRVAEFITRIEWVLAMLWMGAMYVKLGLLAFGAGQAMAGVFGTQSRWFLPVTTFLMLVWSSLIVNNPVEVVALFHPARILPSSLTLELGLPLLLLLTAALRGLRGPEQRRGGSHAHS